MIVWHFGKQILQILVNIQIIGPGTLCQGIQYPVCRYPAWSICKWSVYTLVESARANKLDVYEYLKYLLSEMPNNHHLEDPRVIDRFLPWSEELPEQCRLKTRQKKVPQTMM